MITARGLSVSLAGRSIISPLDLEFSSGQLVVLLGPNGAGKTTLLRALAGLQPAHGHIALEGAALGDVPRAALARKLAFLPQGHHAHWPLAVREIVALGRLPHGLNDPARPGKQDRAAVERALMRMDVAHLAERAITTLSGGERARVMMSRVLAVEAPILFADEPTAALDPRHQISVVAALREEARAGKLVVAVTHDLALAARYADRIVVLDKGLVAADGPPREALADEVLRAVYGITVQRGDVSGEPWVLAWSAAP
ncbi:MAG: ABC transporter ATP-binding protein [Proteobacteria bacterium]|nr:ABC transporter ATP-binding protein [Pseudomonadota bacterium]